MTQKPASLKTASVTPGGADPQSLECPAYPALLRAMAVAIVAGLAALLTWSAPTLQTADWSTSGLVVFGLAAAMIAWVAWWIVFSRTRLSGDTLVQTWLWDKQVRTHEAASFKLVHIEMLEQVMAPRLLVRRRSGGVMWFHASDAGLLKAFALQIVQMQANAVPHKPH